MNHLDLLRGQPCTDFRILAGGSLILYLGDRPDERSLTAWRLHVDTAWRVDGPSGPVVGSLDVCCEGRPAEWIFQGLGSLIGRQIEEATVGAPVRDLRMQFSGGYRLLTFAHCVSESEGWELRHRGGLRIRVRSLTEFVEHREAPDGVADQDAVPDGGRSSAV
jgi:hypothetical protein